MNATKVKMPLSRRLVCLISLMAAGTSAVKALANPSQDIELRVGDRRQIDVRWKGNIVLSRRGILHCLHVANTQWECLALKSGVVMISPTAQIFENSEYNLRRPLLIKVYPQRQSDSKLATETLIFRAHDNDAENQPNITPATTEGIQPTGDQDTHFHLRAWLILIEVDHQEKSGIDHTSQFKSVQNISSVTNGIKSSLPQISGALGLQWTPQDLQSKQDILASPVLSIMTGSIATAHSGGEFHSPTAPGLTIVDSADSDSTIVHPTAKSLTANQGNHWKEHGFRLTIRSKSVSDQRVLLDYALSIKSKSQSDANKNLGSSELSGSIGLTPGAIAVAGAVQLEGDGIDTNQPWHKLPIFGPLFSSKSIHGSRRKVILWLMVERDMKLSEHYGAPPDIFKMQ